MKKSFLRKGASALLAVVMCLSSFLGIGAQPPSTSWGLLVNQTKQYLSLNPTITLAPGIAILILVVAFNFFGDAVRDALDPKLQEQ